MVGQHRAHPRHARVPGRGLAGTHVPRGQPKGPRPPRIGLRRADRVHVHGAPAGHGHSHRLRYVYPTDRDGYDASCSSWVRAADANLDTPLYEAVRAWLATDFPFRHVHYAARPAATAT